MPLLFMNLEYHIDFSALEQCNGHDLIFFPNVVLEWCPIFLFYLFFLLLQEWIKYEVVWNVALK